MQDEELEAELAASGPSPLPTIIVGFMIVMALVAITLTVMEYNSYIKLGVSK